jgi:hypothetical protein
MAATTGDPQIDALYKVRRGRTEFVQVPELAFAMVDGTGGPDGEPFAHALQALYTVSFRAHFALKAATGSAPRVMGLEALWWVEGDEPAAVLQLMGAGTTGEAYQRDRWRWRAMILQLPPIDSAHILHAVSEAAAKRPNPALPLVRFERWTEGLSAQIMHIGPYSTESVSIAALHRAIAQHGYRPRGHHHEIYLGDPRTSAPDKLRTILRQPVEPTP